ncbi:hypothetical protein HOY82DRAFT_602980 [Tuber indicum]|nr:hypothetical protein HOY82DRAFT_602980 [Tuber indicum]
MITSLHSSLPFILNLFLLLLLLTGQTTAHPTERTGPDTRIPTALHPSPMIPLELLRRDLQTSISNFFTTPTIIALSAGGFSFLLIITLLCICCHRKRKQGRQILAAYEAPDRTPYESIRLRERGSVGTASPSATTAASPSTTEVLDVRKNGLQVHVSAVTVPEGGYSPRSSSLGVRGGQGVSVPGRALVRGNGEWEREAAFIPPPASPFTPRPTPPPPFMPYSPSTTPVSPAPPYGPPPQWPVARPYGHGGGGVIGGAM